MQIDKNHNTVREHQRKKKKKKTRTRECQLQQGQFSTIQEDTQVLMTKGQKFIPKYTRASLTGSHTDVGHTCSGFSDLTPAQLQTTEG